MTVRKSLPYLGIARKALQIEDLKKNILQLLEEEHKKIMGLVQSFTMPDISQSKLDEFSAIMPTTGEQVKRSFNVIDGNTVTKHTPNGQREVLDELIEQSEELGLYDDIPSHSSFSTYNAALNIIYNTDMDSKEAISREIAHFDGMIDTVFVDETRNMLLKHIREYLASQLINRD